MMDLNTYNTDKDSLKLISRLKKRVISIESVCGHSLRTVQIRNEISRREALVVYNKCNDHSALANFALN